jgi:hypothetical protein
MDELHRLALEIANEVLGSDDEDPKNVEAARLVLMEAGLTAPPTPSANGMDTPDRQ